ncbi:MAG: Ig-like domain-containing protein [Gemmatimonadetes bacterium]|nr:Ig-like domain-containing protein [Gemmatimonadota bacterium]
MIRPYSRAFAMITASVYFMILAGCGGGDSSPTSPTPSTPTPPPAPPPAPVATGITVTPSSHTLATIGATVQLTATVRDQNNNPMSGQTVTWTSANTAVATVSGNGLVTAVSNGTSQITAHSGNASGTASITVAEPVPTRITVAPSSHTLEAIGSTVQLTATVRDQRNNIMSGQSVTWSSGDEAVATVSGAGLVTAVGNGMVEITAKSGSLSASASITVTTPVATSITIEPASHTLEAIGATVQLMATVRDQSNNVMTDVAVTWSSSDETVATVDDQGLVTAVGNGMAEITAQAGDAMGTAAIIVSQVPANISIEVDAEATTLTEIGQTLQLMVSVSDANDEAIAEPVVSWMSSDETVVTVDEDGLVEAVGDGTAEITAASGDVSDMVSITVMVPDPEIVYVPWTGVGVAPGQLIFTLPGTSIGLPITGCASTLLGGELKDRPALGFTITVHYSIWQRRTDLDSPWVDIEETRKTFDACPYNPTKPGEYRLVGDITIDDERSFRASENTFVVP